jgi:formylglycine-generating enzyme required for sulfatase activity
VIVRTEKKGSPLLWVALIAMSGIAGWLVLNKDSGKGSKGASNAAFPGAPVQTPVSTDPVIAGAPTATTSDPAEATKNRPFVNSLGMKFVPVPGTKVLMSIYETRVQDFRAFVTAVQFDYKKGGWTSYGGKETPDLDWERQTPTGLVAEDQPVLNVSWDDAQVFNLWLTRNERANGLVAPIQNYRLPTEQEWSSAIGADPFGWGTQWPPPPMSGNFSNHVPSNLPNGFAPTPAWDTFDFTSPVGRFSPNAFGIFDLCGNAAEWAQDVHSQNGTNLVRASGSCFATLRDPSSLGKLYRGNSCNSSHRRIGIGFRCVLDLSEAAASTKIKGPVGGAVPGGTLATPMSSIATLPTGPTTWTDTKGRSITATFKAVASGNVLLDIAGKVTPVPLNTLSAESQKLARDYHDQSNPATTNDPTQATMDRPFVNSLGMKFVPVPGTKVLFCIHETRRVDYAAFTKTNPGVGGNWEAALLDDRPLVGEPFDQHPIAKVSRPDAEAFCKWLSAQSPHRYRLPTDAEWSLAADFEEPRSESETPDDLHNKALSGSAARIYPWGREWPPPARAGNYGGAFTPSADTFPTTAPVMTFHPNKHGLYDIGGNLWEWVSDLYWNKQPVYGTLRGGGWLADRETGFRSGCRFGGRQGANGKDFGFRIVLEPPTASSA